MIEWIRTSRFSIKNSLSTPGLAAGRLVFSDMAAEAEFLLMAFAADAFLDTPRNPTTCPAFFCVFVSILHLEATAGVRLVKYKPQCTAGLRLVKYKPQCILVLLPIYPRPSSLLYYSQAQRGVIPHVTLHPKPRTLHPKP